MSVFVFTCILKRENNPKTNKNDYLQGEEENNEKT